MDAVELSNYAGLSAMGLLTLNFLLGLLISIRYNPIRNWPHRRINIFKLHNWNAYLIFGLILLHPTLLLLSTSAGFKLMDILWPLHSPGQTTYNTLGAIAFYVIVFVVVTSYFRAKMQWRVWKFFHFAAYLGGAILFIHGTLIDPNLKNQPTDFLDGEKLLVEGCCLMVITGIIWRIRYGRQKAALKAAAAVR